MRHAYQKKETNTEEKSVSKKESPQPKAHDFRHTAAERETKESLIAYRRFPLSGV